MITKMEYNKTQLNPDIAFERHVFHRDQFAHYLRWSYVLNQAKIGMNILDYGCGSANLAEVLYRNRYKCNAYIGVDIREQTIKNNKEKFKDVPWMHFETQDLVNTKKNFAIEFDFITCFEVIEHIGKQNADKFLQNIKINMSNKTKLLISTPCFDASVGAADNHIINGIICEFSFNEMKELLAKNGFQINETYGTFASQTDYKPYMNDWQIKMFDSLKKYYDSNLISNIMAPLFPEHSRNCIWICQLKKEEVKQ